MNEWINSQLMKVFLLIARSWGCDVELCRRKDNPELVKWIKFIFPKGEQK